MKIYYKPVFTSSLTTNLVNWSFEEVDNPIRLNDLKYSHILEIIASFMYGGESFIITKLLPEQRYVIGCHLSRVWYNCYGGVVNLGRLRFVMAREIRRLAKQEIEPGMFKDENIL
ncbi:MAG: hypothetical protein ACXACY_21665 [Candidatus Hodarchaeales archaeon]|jgi:hypothetical protein